MKIRHRIRSLVVVAIVGMIAALLGACTEAPSREVTTTGSNVAPPRTLDEVMSRTTVIGLLRIDHMTEPHWNSADGKKWGGSDGEYPVDPYLWTVVRATVLQTLAGQALPEEIEFIAIGDARKRVERVDFDYVEGQSPGGGFVVGERFILPLRSMEIREENRRYTGLVAAIPEFANWRIAGTEAVNSHARWNEPAATLIPKLVAAYRTVRGNGPAGEGSP